MTDIVVAPELWASSMLPEGIVEKWFVRDEAMVNAGDQIAEILIENARHMLVAPTSGRLVINTMADDIVEPGSVIESIVSAQRPA